MCYIDSHKYIFASCRLENEGFICQYVRAISVMHQNGCQNTTYFLNGCQIHKLKLYTKLRFPVTVILLQYHVISSTFGQNILPVNELGYLHSDHHYI